jgi:penicillin-binding protein 1A
MAAGNGNGKNGNGRNVSQSGPRFNPGARARRKRRERTRRARTARRLLLFVVVLAALGAAVGVAAAALTGVEAFKSSCTLDSLDEVVIGRNSFVYDANGDLLGAIPAENNREPLEYEEVSPLLVEATVAIEDQRFWEHDGIDYESIVRAAFANFKAQDVVQGGSTITQQLVRNLYRPVGTEQTLKRKLKEACLALKLDRAWEKEQILEAYLNQVYYGHRAYGVEAAAQTYFSKSARQLTIPEAALLAGLPQAPSFFDPINRPQEAAARRNDVLLAMRDTAAISEEQYRQAVQTQIHLKPGRLFTEIKEPFFFGFVRDQLIAEYGASVVRAGGLRIYTTIDPRWQKQAEEAIRETLNDPADPASAIVAINPRNGAIRAMVSVLPGKRRTQFNIAAQGRRQAGSAFKTFVLTEAIRRGINPDTTTYVSAPFTWQPDPASEPWNVKTYDNSYYGPSSLTASTLRSDNSVYARLTLDLGPESIVKIAHAMGVRSPLKPVASIGLGSNDVSVLDMASAYATLAAGGLYHEPMAIRRVEFPNGKEDTESGWGKPKPKRVMPDGVAYQVTRILEQNVLSGTGTRAYFGRPAAGKTGTTDDHTDAWFVGYTPQLATAVWVGYPSATIEMTNVHGISVSGGSFPAVIWNLFMSSVLANAPVLDWPLPKEQVVWRPWHGQYQLEGDTSTTETGTTAETETETQPEPPTTAEPSVPEPTLPPPTVTVPTEPPPTTEPPPPTEPPPGTTAPPPPPPP